MKIRKYIYGAYTGVDPGMSNMGDISCQHPNHSSRAKHQPQQPRWSESCFSHMRPLTQAVHRSL